MKVEYVFHRKIGLDNKPHLYHFVRRYSCPEGCVVHLDFSKAKPLRPGTVPMVLPKVVELRKKADFNDILLGAGLGVMLSLIVVAIVLIPTSVWIKLIGTFLVAVFASAVYVYANQRVILPEAFPLPVPEPSVEEEQASRAPAPKELVAAGAAAEGAAKKKAAAPVEVPAEIPPLERKEGEPIRMTVILGGEEYVIEVNEGENMLDAALDRSVEIDYSCREGMCDSCAVQILAGINNISPPTQEEFDMLGDDVQKGQRLACQVKVYGPVKLMQG